MFLISINVITFVAYLQLGEKDFVAFVGGPSFAHTLLVSPW